MEPPIDDYRDCDECSGYGWVANDDPEFIVDKASKKCPKCGGSGQIPYRLAVEPIPVRPAEPENGTRS